MPVFNNWKCFSYIFSHSNKEFGYNELKDYFFIDGSEVIYCKKNFGSCKAGKYYLISDGKWYGRGFIVHDWDVAGMEAGFECWSDKEYMKEG